MAMKSPSHSIRRVLVTIDAFTLPELLVGVVLGAVVLAALGGSVLVSQMRISTKIRSDIERRDALNRAVDLMRGEIAAADRVVIDKVGFSRCPKPNLTLQFSREAQTEICYSSQLLSVLKNSSRNFRDADKVWSGPCVLTRLGPRYLPDSGKLNFLDTASNRPVQVILDNLSNCAAGSSSFMVTPGQGSSDDAVIRDVDIQIRQTFDKDISFSARVGSNPLFSDPALPSQVGPTCSWKSAQSTIPPECMKNIYYFQKSFNKYEVSTCTPVSCKVQDKDTGDTGIYKNADVLVFTDREIRP